MLAGLDEKVRSDFHVMRDLAMHTRLAPNERVRRLEELMRQINDSGKARREMENWNLALATDPLQINGRVLDPASIFQRNQLIKYEQKEADWSHGMRGMAIDAPMPLSSWLLVYPGRNAGNARELLKALQRVCPPMGMNITAPMMVELPNDNTQTYLSCLQEKVTRNTKLVLCVLPTNRKDRYDAIKVFLCCERPVPSQMILDRTLCKPQMLMSVATKVAIQMNCKMGGEVWHSDAMQDVMVVGIDTYHDSSRKGRSVAGVVASYNKALTR